MKFVENLSEFSLWFRNAENEKFQKIYPMVSSLEYKLSVKILKYRNRKKCPFSTQPTPQLYLDVF